MNPASPVPADAAAQVFERSAGRALLGAGLAAAVGGGSAMLLAHGLWASGALLALAAGPALAAMLGAVRRVRRGDVVVDARGVLDRATPHGWIAWADVEHVRWNALAATVTLHLRARPAASQRLGRERGTPDAPPPAKVVIHTFTLPISYADFVALVARHAPLRTRPAADAVRGLYNGD